MTVNETLADAAVGHAVDLQQYGGGVVRRMIALLNRVDADLFAQLAAALDRMDAETFTTERLESLLVSVRALNRSAYQSIERELTDELRRLAEVESTYQLDLFASVLPPQIAASVTVAAVSAEQVYAAAMSRPFQGALLREWASRIEEQRMTRIRDALRIGYVENQTIDQMVRRIRGTRAAKYADGLIEIDRRNAQAVVRTATQHVASFVRDRFHEANSDILASVRWSSTIDLRTTEICRLRDGKRYTLDHKPIGHSIPWLAGPGRSHWACRSTSAAVTKSWRELGIDMDDLSPGTRASMDGQIPADTTYGEWLAKQSAARQDEVVGPTRGALMRAGKLPYDSLYTDRGVYLTLDQLRERHAAAFRKAGV